MNVQLLKERLKDYARDTRINLSSVLSEEGAPGLTPKQIWGTALSCAYTIKNQNLIEAVANDTETVLNDIEREAIKGAASIMAMNNIYYRFLHLIEDKEFSHLPAKLRMQIIARPGIEKIDFELFCLAISSLNGCGMCMNAHLDELRKGGMSREGIQSAVRIAAVMNAFAQSLAID